MLSIVICTYNRAESLRISIDSLANQIGLEDKSVCEILVVDNNSKDHTRDVVETAARISPISIRYVFEPTQGKTYALNTGIAHSRGEMIAFTDDDVIADEKWIVSILEAEDRYPYKAFGGKVVPLWPSSIPPWVQRNGPYARPIVGSPIVSHDCGDDIKEYGDGMWVPIGANMFFRKEAFRKFGGFRTDLGPKGEVYGPYEDSEIGFRLKNSGEPILYFPRAVIYHPVLEYRLSKDYLLKHFWNAGFTRARLDDGPLPFIRRSKAIAKSIMYLTSRCAKYVFSFGPDRAAMKMHHKCHVYYQTGVLYYHTVKSMTADS